jgi:hypothetical protein
MHNVFNGTPPFASGESILFEEDERDWRVEGSLL